MSNRLSHDLETRFVSAIDTLWGPTGIPSWKRFEIIELLKLGRESLRMEAQRLQSAIDVADSVIEEHGLKIDP